MGLTDEEVLEKQKNGESNGTVKVKTKSVPQIIRDNFLTLFNLVNIILAVLIISVGSYRNVLFMGVVLSNIAIGTIQEIRSKRVIDKLSVLTAPKARVIRGGKEKDIPTSEIVTDDIMILKSGSQVCADAEVIEGECETDESLVTGESEPIGKKAGSRLLSGSFVTSGYVKARAVRVGENSTSGKITREAGNVKKRSSEMLASINKIVKIVSICIIPFGVIMLVKGLFFTDQSIRSTITSTAAALIGMIPEGLVLLTSTALAVSSIRLARHKVLCSDLYCTEELARVDVLCLDKTGTLTEGKQEVSEVELLDKNFDAENVLGLFSSAFQDSNSTLKAIRERFGGNRNIEKPLSVIPFSSSRKLSAAEFKNVGTLVLGAASFVLNDNRSEILQKCEKYSSQGKRVLLLAHSSAPLKDGVIPEQLTPIALIVLTDKLRKSAEGALKYFRSQGVAVKVISGDDPLTVSCTAERAGLENAGEYVDMSAVSDDLLPETAEKYTVFGRVSPSQKPKIIKALKESGHKTAMIGDGVNDVPALRAADCSAAVNSGSDAARCAAQIVLMDSDFSSMPLAVEEGRRCINNIQRSASLFLIKTISSFLMSAIFLFIPLEYPFKPIQMTLVGALSIGIPSFLLTFEPNKNRVDGSFISNVMKKAAPPGISLCVGIILLEIAAVIFRFSNEHISTMAVFQMAAVCFAALSGVCMPFNKRRAVMLATLLSVFALEVLFFGEIFFITALNMTEIIVMIILIISEWGIMALLKLIINRRIIPKV